MRTWGLVVAVLVGAWLLWPSGETPSTAVDAPEAAEPPADPTLLGRSPDGIAEPTPTAPISEPGGSEPAADDSLPDTAPVVRLRLVLVGWDDAIGGTAHVRIAPRHGDGPRDGVTVQLEEVRSGTTLLDVSRHLHDPAVTGLEIAVSHPAYLPATGTVPIDGPLRGEVELPATLRLVRALGITGRIVDAARSPLAGAAVAVHVAGPDGPVVAESRRFVESSVETARTAGDGTFLVRVREPGRYVLTAAAEGHQPAHAWVDVGPRGQTEPVQFLLRPASTIEGVVRLNGKPAPGATVAARLVAGRWSYTVGPQWHLAWLRGPWVAYETATTDADGRFRLENLAPDRYRIEVQGLEATWDAACAEATEREALAPAREVRLDVQAAEVALLLRDEDGEEAWGTITLSPGGIYEQVVDGDGIRVLLVPGRRYRLAVDSAEHEAPEVELVAPAAGTRTRHVVTMTPRTAAVGLDLGLVDEHGETIESAMLEFHRDDDEVKASMTTGLIAEDGRLRVRSLAPGTWHVRVLPGTWDGDATEVYVPIERDVLVPADGAARLDLVAVLGARLQVAAREPGGGFLEAACVVRDAHVRTLRLTYSSFGPSYSARGRSTLGGDSPSTSEQGLAPGRYEVELTADGFQSRRASVVVEAGKTAVVDVTLAR